MDGEREISAFKQRVMEATQHHCRLPYDEESLPDTWPALAEEMDSILAQARGLVRRLYRCREQARRNAESQASSLPNP